YDESAIRIARVNLPPLQAAGPEEQFRSEPVRNGRNWNARFKAYRCGSFDGGDRGHDRWFCNWRSKRRRTAETDYRNGRRVSAVQFHQSGWLSFRLRC